ncbi:MAG: efflux RND transporter periplasmic adaptor subunit [Odoribacter sp.]|nr:efflux RND transporter periplasmic adaptor subunit [Odoribacter sp.]
MDIYKKHIVSCCAIACVMLSSCGGKGESDTATAVNDEAPELAIVDVDVAHRVTVPHTVSYTANIEAENVNNIAPAMANRIKTITVDVGDHVRRGQVLATLDATTADQQRLNLEQARRDYERAVQLLEIGAGTRSTVDQLKTQLDALATQYDNTITNTVLTSPINGVVTARNYDPGDMTGAQPILTVGQITPSVKVMINVNESDISRITRGMQVEVSLDAFEGETFTGRVTRVAPAVDVATRTFPAEVTLANPQGRILPGMFARVIINLGDRESVVVPDLAIDKQRGSNNKYVYVYKDGKVSYNKVELGSRLDTGYELLSGVNEGDTIVVAGQSRLAHGVEVIINDKK